MVFAFYTLGCKANQFDTQAMERICIDRGHRVVPFRDSADIYVVNTCAVTAESGRKSRQAVRGIRRTAPDAIVGVCGCFSQTDAAAKSLGADVVGGTADRAGFIKLLEEAAQGKTAPYEFELPDDPAFERLPAGGYEGRTRALLKVQDGCDNFCAYCIIPYARSRARSLPLADAVNDVCKLAEQGYREVVITGIEISSYGRDFADGTGLADLISAICAAVPEVRIRLGSLEPRTITQEFCERLAVYPNLMPHFHLSLQSGCDDTLARMRRSYNTSRFIESVHLIRRFFTNAGVGADLITGFPGESEAEFTNTLRFVGMCGFSAMHIFPYSIRPGTPAADMPQVPRTLREERAREATRLAANMRRSFLKEQLGKRHAVLFEAPSDGVQTGHTGNYLPFFITSEENLQGEVREVLITGADNHRLSGVIE